MSEMQTLSLAFSQMGLKHFVVLQGLVGPKDKNVSFASKQVITGENELNIMKDADCMFQINTETSLTNDT